MYHGIKNSAESYWSSFIWSHHRAKNRKALVMALRRSAETHLHKEPWFSDFHRLSISILISQKPISGIHYVLLHGRSSIYATRQGCLVCLASHDRCVGKGECAHGFLPRLTCSLARARQHILTVDMSVGCPASGVSVFNFCSFDNWTNNRDGETEHN